MKSVEDSETGGLRPSAPTSVQVSVTINAEPETVWRFMSEQDKLLAWMTFIPAPPSPIPAGSTFEPRPGGKLAADGPPPPQQQHGFVRFGWAVRTPDGRAMLAGQNFARLTAGGKIVEMVGFMNGPG